jgi:hypothetical protein
MFHNLSWVTAALKGTCLSLGANRARLSEGATIN